MGPRGLSVILTLLLLCTATRVSAQQMSEEKYSLRGRVVNAVTGEPVGGALVELSSGTRRAQFSAADGRFEFAELARGSYILSARKPGFFDDRELGREEPGAQTAYALPSDETAVLKLTPEGVISGRVEDEKGKPLEGVSVQAEMWVVANGTKQLQPWPGGSIATDDEGNFRIAELLPGEYYLKFSEPGASGTVFRDTPARPRAKKIGEGGEGKKGYGTQYYPGVAEESLATVIHVRAGVEVPVQQALEPLPLYDIAGVVRGAPNGEGFAVSLLAAGSAFGEPRGKSLVFPNMGEFRIEGVPPGRYLLIARAADPNNQGPLRRAAELIAQTALEVNGEVTGVVLMLGHGWTIDVRVSEVSTNAADYGHRVTANLQSTEFPQQMQQVLVPLLVNDPRASRGFENVAAGTYSVEAWAEGWGYVASIRCAGVDLLKEDLRVGSGASVGPIEITLRNDGATLNLSAVENGKPVPARVIVYSEEYPRRSRVIFAWPASMSAVPNLAPGTYKLVATRGIHEPEFRDPAAMAKYLAHAQSVTLAPDSNVNVQVEVQEEAEP